MFLKLVPSWPGLVALFSAAVLRLCVCVCVSRPHRLFRLCCEVASGPHTLVASGLAGNVSVILIFIFSVSARVALVAIRLLLCLRQYLYVCTSKASEMSGKLSGKLKSTCAILMCSRLWLTVPILRSTYIVA